MPATAAIAKRECTNSDCTYLQQQIVNLRYYSETSLVMYSIGPPLHDKQDITAGPVEHQNLVLASNAPLQGGGVLSELQRVESIRPAVK